MDISNNPNDLNTFFNPGNTGNPTPAPAPTPAPVATTTPTPAPVATPAGSTPDPAPSGAGIDDQTYLGFLNGLNTSLQQKNTFVTQKQAVMNALLGNPIDPTTLASLPPDVQSVITSGNKNALLLQAQILNDTINGNSSSIAASIGFLTSGYEAAQKQAEQDKQDAFTNLQQIAQNFVIPIGQPGAGTIDVSRLTQAFAGLFPGIDMSGVIAQLQGLEPVSEYNKNFYEGTVTPTTNAPGTVTGNASVGSYDLSSYATDPGYVSSIQSIAANIGPITDASSAQSYITANYPDSPITGAMVMQAAQQAGVDPTVMMAQLQKESSFGTSKDTQVDNNPTGITWTQAYQDANPGTSKGAPRPEGGNYVHFDTLQDGIQANANWLASHPATSDAGANVQQDVISYATGIQNGTITSLASIPGANMKSLVANYMAQNGIQSPLGDRRYIQASNSLIANYIAQPEYVLTQNALPYLLKIDAAMTVPGSVSDQELLDSFTKMSTAGGVITDAQVAVITGGRSLADVTDVYAKQLASGGVLSDAQRQQIYQLSQITFKNLQAGYQPIYDKATASLTNAGIPSQYWTLPDLNSLAALSEAAVANDGTGSPVSGSTSTSTGSTTGAPAGGGSYSDYLSAIGQ